MNRIRVILIDLSGTLHIDKELVTGSIEALAKLRHSPNNFKLKFVTNTTKESKKNLCSLLASLGFSIDSSEIFTSLTAAHNLIKQCQLRPMLFLEPSALEDFSDINTENPNAVVVGLAPNRFDYKNLNDAFRLLLNGAKLIAIHKARYFKQNDGLSLGPGAFVSGLEFSANVTAEVVGKPSGKFFMASIDEFNVTPDECIMIGDDALDDIQGAQCVGMHGILVKTGKYRDNDESKLEKAPLYVARDFAQAVEFILENF